MARSSASIFVVVSESDESPCSEPGLRFDEVTDSESEDSSKVTKPTDAGEEEELEGAASAAHRICNLSTLHI